MERSVIQGVEGQADTSTMLGKALEVIRLLSTRSEYVGTREAARLINIDKSAVSRILGYLEHHGWAQRNPINDKYRAGPALYAVGAALRNADDVWNYARDQLVRLNQQFGETVYLTSRVEDSLVFRDKIETNHPIRYVVDLGVAFPLASGGASATAVMSALSAGEQTYLLRNGLTKYTQNSVVDVKEFQKILHEDRSKGYSVSHGRWAENGGGVASPYFEEDGSCRGSVTLSCPLFRLERLDIEEVGVSVREAARSISLRLGHQRFS